MSYLYFDKIGFSIRFPYFSCLVWEHLIKNFTMMTEAVNFVAVFFHIKEHFWFKYHNQSNCQFEKEKNYVFFSNINCRTIEKGEHKVFFSYLEGFLFHKNSFVVTLIFFGCFLWIMWKNGANRLGSDFRRFSLEHFLSNKTFKLILNFDSSCYFCGCFLCM